MCLVTKDKTKNFYALSTRSTGSIREIETTVFDPASVFLSTHWWSQNPASQFLAKEACSFYKRDLFRRFSAHPASVFLKHSGRNWAKSRLQFLSASFYVPERPCTRIYVYACIYVLISVCVFIYVFIYVFMSCVYICTNICTSCLATEVNIRTYTRIDT